MSAEHKLIRKVMALIHACKRNGLAVTVLLALAAVCPVEGEREHHTLNGTGNFSSPNYPGAYPNNCHIDWEIKAPPGHVVKLVITDFRLADVPACGDSFEILDGSIDDLPHRIYYRCGSNASWQNTIESSIHVMTVKFTSDGSGTAAGFKAEFSHTPYKIEFMLVADHTNLGVLALNILRQWNLKTDRVPGAEGRLVGKLEYDPVMKQLYFTDEGNKTLWRMNRDSSGAELLIEGERDVRGFTLNSRSRTLYYIAGDDIIASRMDGTMRYRVGGGSERTRDLATDYISSYVFWVSGDNTAATIVRYNGDGTKRKEFDNADVGDPRGLTVYYHENGTITLYVCDLLRSTIRRFSIDGVDMGDVEAPEGSINDPLSVTLDSSGNIYWTEQSRFGLEVLDSHGVHYPVPRVLGESRKLAALIVYSSPVAAPYQCQNSCDAKLLCLPVPLSGAHCIRVLPTIHHCPHDIHEFTTSSSKIVKWQEPTAHWPRSKVPTVNRTCDPGSSFEVGNTSVEYVFQDELGNVAVCAFTVTITRQDASVLWIISAALVLVVALVVITSALLFYTGRLYERRRLQGEDGHELGERADELDAGAGPDDQGRQEERPPGNAPAPEGREGERAPENIAGLGDPGNPVVRPPGQVDNVPAPGRGLDLPAEGDVDDERAPLIDHHGEELPEGLLGNLLRRLF